MSQSKTVHYTFQNQENNPSVYWAYRGFFTFICQTRDHLWKTWSNLTQVVKTGKSAHPTEINDRGGDWLFAFINAMHDRAKKQAPPEFDSCVL